MSIKSKLSLSISGIVAFILFLNIGIHYMSSKSAREELLEQQLHTIAEQLVVTIESTEQMKMSMEYELGRKLRIAALLAKAKLDPDIAAITNEQLVSLAQEIEIDDITLWQQIDGENVVVRSSNPDELHISSKTWDYWNMALHDIFAMKKVNAGKGQTAPYYWSGPINYAFSDPSDINKWGYYYDGTTNYMINTMVNVAANSQFDFLNGTNNVIHKMLSQESGLLEITAFDPEFFGEEPIIKMKQGIPVHNLDVKAIPFGTYHYPNHKKDFDRMTEALNSRQSLSFDDKINGLDLVRSYIPIEVAGRPYVIGVSFDNRIIQEPVQKQLLMHALISLVLILLTMLFSYSVAGHMIRPLQQILHKVNDIASGSFTYKLSIDRRDELGTLSTRINTMGMNLQQYMTQLKDTASELRSTKQYLESFFNHTSDAIHVIDLDRNVVQVNDAFETIYGWSESEILGHPLPNIPEDQRLAYEQLLIKILNGGSVTDYETTRYTKDGQSIDVSITVSPVRDEHEQIVAVASISRNITSRKQAEEMIRRSEKLSVVGQLAAGVAHEIRNPLTTLRGFVQLHQKNGALTPLHLNLMMAELDQINMIVSEFLVLAKPQANRFERVIVEELICDIIMLLDSSAKLGNVDLVYRNVEDRDVPPIYGVSNQLKQVFVNVLKNGIEAMAENGGELVIELSCRGSDTVVIRFIDQGCGISDEDKVRIGEPFFTKKESGSGLGLMVCQQIITNHKGSLTFDSELGQGTTVEIALPVMQQEQSA
ncbi:PAS domain S-box protein [Paenibacillus sp. J5C_2022]|uniref:PAS domain S-box protein n=1 Tax=Paenibacillus sp. J5C2022 TaxID=2977129 RepID=UPI0021D2D81F|nr:PAS domain S-box protein [Paenibacillus sp. J5C2022]MCU6710765.1 PAS domain S-box protein [Paenibacillus sp. J5C2022]